MYCYERLRDLREDADLTQKEVGALLHTTQQQYANMSWVCRRSRHII